MAPRRSLSMIGHEERESCTVYITNDDSKAFNGRRAVYCDEVEHGDNSFWSSSSSSSSMGKWIVWIGVLQFGASLFLGGLTFSLLSPFYTKEATLKGVSVTTSGLVFGSVHVTQIVFMPLFGKNVNMFGSKLLFLGGIALAGLANVIFGMLEWIEDTTVFITLSFLIRIASAIGDSAFMAVVYPLVTKTVEYKHRGTAISVLETMYGVGMMVGPAFGGFLYDLNGFYLPFSVCGGALLLNCLTGCILLRQRSHDSNGEERATNTSYRRLLRQSSIILPFLILLLCEMAVSWLNPSLEPFLATNFNVSSAVTGVIFSMEGMTYALFAPMWGFLFDKGISAHICLLFGTLANITGLLIVGPVPFLSLPKSPYVTGVGLFILGSGAAATFITTLTYMLAKGTTGMNDLPTEQTRGMIVSLWMVSENVGGFAGTYLGGLAYDKVGFENGLLIVAGIQLIALAALLILWSLDNTAKRKNLSEDESTPLITNEIISE